LFTEGKSTYIGHIIDSKSTESPEQENFLELRMNKKTSMSLQIILKQLHKKYVVPIAKLTCNNKGWSLLLANV
jgi:hypothetical protein